MQSFVDEPTQEGINDLRKAELVEVAKLLEIPIKVFDKKAQIKETITQFFVKTSVWPASMPDDKEVGADSDDGSTASSLSSSASSSRKRMSKLEV